MPANSNPAEATSELALLKAELAAAKAALASKEADLLRIQKRLERYTTAAEGANDGLWDLDLRTGEVFISSPWYTMLGFNAQEIKEEPGQWEALLHPEDRDRATTALKDYIDNKVPKYDLEFRLRHKDGSYRWVHSRAEAIRGADGKALRVSGSHTDITDRKKGNQLLVQREQKFRHLFENSLVGMMRTDPHTGTLIEANAKALEMLGVTKDQAQSGSLSVYAYYHSIEERNALVQAIFKQGAVENYEIKLKRHNGKPFWASVSARYYEQEGLVESVIKDISDMKLNLIELQKVNYELDSFVYHASHDLRSPLRSILGLTNLLRKENNPSMRESILLMIEDAIQRLDGLVVDLLGMSRNNRLEIKNEPICLLAEIDQIIQNYTFDEHQPTVEFIIHVLQPVALYTDLTRIRIILNNLISNAIKYSDAQKADRYVHVTTKTNAEQVEISIKDNGEGIQADKQQAIFDMFYRASEKSQGSGLGLYIVKNVIDKLEGTIEVTSEEGKGTCFTVTLPNKQQVAQVEGVV